MKLLAGAAAATVAAVLRVCGGAATVPGARSQCGDAGSGLLAGARAEIPRRVLAGGDTSNDMFSQWRESRAIWNKGYHPHAD